MKKAFKFIPSRTAETTRRYLDRARQLLLKIPDEFMANPEIGLAPTDIAEWLKQRAPSLRKSAFRQDKASLVCYLNHMSNQSPDAATAAEYAAGAASVHAISSSLAAPRKSLPDRTSSGKVKYVHLDDLMTLGQTMLTVRSRWTVRAYVWLAAGIAAGLRPAEWRNTQIVTETDDGGLILQIENAKNTNGRAGTEFREIIIPPGWMTDYTRSHFRSLTAWIHAGNTYQAYYKAASQSLGLAVRKTWPNQPRRHYSLYSGRHQFCANLKRSGASKDEIAQQMGHASKDTATSHYGKRRSGHSGLLMKVAMPSLRNVTSMHTPTPSTP